jgi:diketogulonate reductase-like aldo/keto reductase
LTCQYNPTPLPSLPNTTPNPSRYLIHAPYGGVEARKGSWRALVEAQQAGKIRSIGVSNYGVHHLDELEAYIKELEEKNGKGKGGEISVGQWELHPWLGRRDIVEWCEKRGVILEAYCPVVRGLRFNEPILVQLGKKYSKTPAQVLIRWSLQKVGLYSLLAEDPG